MCALCPSVTYRDGDNGGDAGVAPLSHFGSTHPPASVLAAIILAHLTTNPVVHRQSP